MGSQNFLAARERFAALGGSIRSCIRDMSNATSGTRVIGNTVGTVRHVLMAGITSGCRPTFSRSISFPGSGNFSVAPADIRDSNMFLYSSTRLFCGLHSKMLSWRAETNLTPLGQHISHEGVSLQEGIARVRTSLNASSKMEWDSLFKKAFVFKSLRSENCGKAGHHAHLLLNGHNFKGPIWRLTRREQPASQQTQARKEVTSISLAPNWAREPFFEVFVVTGPAGRWVIEKVVPRTRSSSDMPFKPAKQ